MDGATSCGIDCISALGRARLDGHGRDCVVSSPLLPAVGWSSFSRLRPAGSRSLGACAATCRLPVGLSSCAFWCCSKASFCAFFWSWYFAGSWYFGPGTLLVLVRWPGTLAEGGILEGYFAFAESDNRRSCMSHISAPLALCPDTLLRAWPTSSATEIFTFPPCDFLRMPTSSSPG